MLFNDYVNIFFSLYVVHRLVLVSFFRNILISIEREREVINMAIGNKIKQYREERKMTQKDIAEILEVGTGSIYKYDRVLLKVI